MVQAAVLGGQFFDPFSLFDDGGVASKVGVGWSYVADALVVALVVVVIDEGADLVFETAGQIIIFKQDPVLQRLMPALDLALGLRVIRCAPNVGVGWSYVADALVVALVVVVIDEGADLVFQRPPGR